MYKSIYFSIILLLGGCGLVPSMSPVISEERVVVVIEDKDQSLTLSEPQVWFDGYQKTAGVMLPKGDYILEAQDSDYLYFRAPLNVEFRSLQTQPPKQEFVSGGIALSKDGVNFIIPAAIYESSDSNTMIFRWKLGSHFLRMEGDNWFKNF